MRWWLLACAACGRIDFQLVPDGRPPADAPTAVVASFEAESGVVSPNFTIVPDSTVSGGAYVLDGNTNGTTGPGDVVYTFVVAVSGTYYVWGRNMASDTSNDSFFTSVDGAAKVEYDTSDCVYGSWHWAAQRPLYSCPSLPAPMPFTLAPGMHTLRLSSREGQSRIDRVAITDDPAYVPTD